MEESLKHQPYISCALQSLSRTLWVPSLDSHVFVSKCPSFTIPNFNTITAYGASNDVVLDLAEQRGRLVFGWNFAYVPRKPS